MGFDSITDDQFRLVAEASPAAMIVIGGDGDIRYANAETERMFGYRPQELIGKSVEILVPERLRRDHASLRQAFVAGPSKRPMGGGRCLVGARRDGTEIPVEIGLTPVETGAGPVVVATLVDVTERREAETALARRAAELERANERLARFAYLASRDLQAPLRKIAAFSDVLEQAIGSSNLEDMAKASQVMRASALGARKLVEDLLTYSRTIYGEQHLEILDLREEIQFTLADLSEQIIETRAEIRVEVLPTTFLADRPQFARLMHNIISNAIRYRKPGQAAKIDITAVSVDDQAIRLAIADSGVGFEEEFAHTIFEPFKQRHDKGDYSGTGIELAICKSIADRHDWEISVRSRPGEGATFFFTIPTLVAISPLGQNEMDCG